MEMHLFKNEFQGAPASWGKIEETQKSCLAPINARYHMGVGYKDNCVNCVMAYELRQRGYDVIAKSSKECNVKGKAKKMWENVIEKRAELFTDVLEAINLSEDARYFFGVNYKNGAGHAMVLEVKNRQVIIIDAQIGKTYNIDSVNEDLYSSFSFWRIDNLTITQTGYNACEGGIHYDV